MSTTTFQVSGMSCDHCERAIREELERVGMEVVELSAATGRLVVGGEAAEESRVLAAVDEAGYDAVRL